MVRKRLAIIGVIAAVIVIAVSQFLSPLLFGKEVSFNVNALMGSDKEEHYIMFFLDNTGDQSLEVKEINIRGNKVFPGQPISISLDGATAQTKDRITLNPKETCLAKINISWNLGEECDIRVSASALDQALIAHLKTHQFTVKAPSTLRQDSLLRLGSPSVFKENDGSLSASLDVEANGLDWVRVMLFTHYTATWPGFRPIKFYYEPVFNNSAIGDKPEIMSYYSKVSDILSSIGIEVEIIDSFGLWALMTEMQPAVVMMGVDILPKFGEPPIWYGEENQTSLASRWLKAGGVLVWIGDYLGYYYGEIKNGSRMQLPGLLEAWKTHPGRIDWYCRHGDWWLLGYDPLTGSNINMELTPTRAGKTLGLKTRCVDLPIVLKGERDGPALPANAYFYGRYEDRLKELALSPVAYLPALEGEGGVWYVGVRESAPARYRTSAEARFPAWDDLVNDVAWDTAVAIIHSVWTGVTGQGEEDTAYTYFSTMKGYIGGRLKLQTLPLTYPEEMNKLTIRIVAIGYESETQRYFYSEATSSVSV